MEVMLQTSLVNLSETAHRLRSWCVKLKSSGSLLPHANRLWFVYKVLPDKDQLYTTHLRYVGSVWVVLVWEEMKS